MGSAALETVEANRPTRGGNHNKGAKHFSASDYADILRWHGQGLTQQEIAARLGRPNSQGQVSKAIREFALDSTPEAKQILRGAAAKMALNVVRKGQPKDHILALKGINVLEEQQQQGLTVIVGGDATVTIGVLVGGAGQALSPLPVTVTSETP